MGKVRGKQSLVRFLCDACGHEWPGAPGRVEDVPDKSHHPWDYFAECPVCGEEAGQHPTEQRLLKAWANATGPRSAEGKARSAANLEGHPTPEEARRTRFNALKTGVHAEVATYFPAAPGRYPECDGCPYFEPCFSATACQRKTELFLTHHIAFEQGDPQMLQGIRARIHAATVAMIEMCIQKVLAQGVTLEHPAWYYDKEGGFHLASYTGDDGEECLIHEVKEHPLLKRISDFIKATGMTLSDSGMTMASQPEDEALEGHLSDEGGRDSAIEYARETNKMLGHLRGIIESAKQDAQRDPILIEHQGEQGD